MNDFISLALILLIMLIIPIGVLYIAEKLGIIPWY